MPDPPKLLDRVRNAVRVRHYSRRTEEAYVMWIRRFILYHGKRHPSAMGADEVNAFLSTPFAIFEHASRGGATPSASLPLLRDAPHRLVAAPRI